MDKSQEPPHPVETRGRPAERTPRPGEEFPDHLEGRESPETHPVPSVTARPAGDRVHGGELVTLVHWSRWESGDVHSIGFWQQGQLGEASIEHREQAKRP